MPSYWRRLSVLGGAVALATLAAGCGSSEPPSQSNEAAGTSTVAAFYPLAWLAEQVGGDRVEVDLLTSPGVEPHDLELNPRQIAAIVEADVALFLQGLQPAVDDAVEQGVRGTAIDATEVVDMLPTDESGDSEPDPHLWLDPLRMAELAERVGEAYAEANPDNADAYDSAVDTVVADLEQLDGEYQQTLVDCRTRTVVTSHDAFGYVADRYNLELLPIAGIDPANEPSPERLAKLVDLVKAEDVTTIFTETLVSPAVAETLANETGLDVATLDPIEGLSDQTAGEDYLSLMRANLSALAQANGC
ncbi:MAG: metal ABC transporter substrate-binding protein [Actinomycetota bacterium]|nr:metal ABC transporter substrate-binding protein [Actinomycetota bacterium]